MAGDKLTFKVVKTASDHKGSVPITEISHQSGFKAFAYQCSLEEDLDGAPNAYGLDNPNPVDPQHNPSTMLQRGLHMKETSLANAADPAPNCTFALKHPGVPAIARPVFRWVGVLAMNQANATANGLSIDRRGFLEARGRRDANSHLVVFGPAEPGLFPVIQPAVLPGGASLSLAPGYYVSTTAAATDDRLAAWDQRRYVNALTIPYAAWAGWWHGFGVEKGDFGLAIRRNTGAFSGFIFGDAGSGNVGEVSRKLFERLTPERNNEDSFIFLVFPGSGNGIVNRFTDDNLITAQVNHNIRRTNSIPDNEDLAEFLADDANLTTMKTVLAARHLEEIKAEKKGTTRPLDAGEWRRGSITVALRMSGFWPSRRGLILAGPGPWADPPPPSPAAPRPLIF